MRRLLAAAFAAASLLVLAAPADAARTVFTGQWQCDDRGEISGLGGIEVQLWRRGWDWFPAEVTGSIDDRGFTNDDGTFRLTATDSEDTHFVRMALRDAAGVRLKDFWGINDWSIDTVGTRNNVTTRDFGGLMLSTPGQSHKCAVWQGLHKAHKDFRDVTGTNPPSGGLLVNADAITAGVPFTPHTAIMWPGGFPVGYGGGGDDSITRHEFGHVIRHGYDGDFGHFLGDVATHNYLQNHAPCNRTNPGFAFNEGWAEYWARDYGPAPAGCGGAPADDYSIEGNVAAALTEIEARCYMGNRAAMVNILRANPGVIHSFLEFRARVTCPVPPVVAVLPPITTRPLAIPTAVASSLARAQVAAIGRDLRELRGDLRVAVRRAENIPVCTRTPCTAALRRATLPAALRIEVALAELVRRTVDDGDTVKEQEAIGKLGEAAATNRMKAKEKANRTKAADVLGDGIRDALRAGRRIFGRDKSRATSRMRRMLTSRLATFRKAQRNGTATSLMLDQAILDRLRKVSKKSFPPPPPRPPSFVLVPPPPPPPPPAVDPRPLSTLTIVCPPATEKPGVFAISGNLTPVHAGVDVELHVTSPASVTAVQTTKTNANGAYSAGVAMQAVGTWSIFARWAGDADTQPDDSPVCKTTIAP